MLLQDNNFNSTYSILSSIAQFFDVFVPWAQSIHSGKGGPENPAAELARRAQRVMR